MSALDLDTYNPSVNLILGYNLLYAERFEEAEKYLDQYLDLLPEAPNSYDSKGDLYMAWGKYGLAYESFMKAHDLGWSDVKAKKAKAKLDELNTEMEEDE
jgi:tetratricopeptide (TPR) repeat protein